MKRGVLGCLLGLALASPLAAAEEESRWIGDWDKAREAAREAGKPIFVVFR